MATFLFYLVVLTFALVFLLTVAHDELAHLYDLIMDASHRLFS